jgi:putative transposase
VLSERPALAWPAASTIGDLLRREGLSRPRRRRRCAWPASRPFLSASAPNEVWCADFKGWFRTRDGARCDPLTITDAHSRFLLDCRITAPTGDGGAACVRAGVQGVRAAAGDAHRQRSAVRVDRRRRASRPRLHDAGTAGGLSRLAVHWVKLGIRLERIAPGPPQQNGRHERMHRTLNAETSAPPAATPPQQQARVDAFRRHYNHERPHEALGQQTPAEHYRPSPRGYGIHTWWDAVPIR